MAKPKNTICLWFDHDAEEALNGGDVFKHTEAFSFQIATGDQAETDEIPIKPDRDQR